MSTFCANPAFLSLDAADHPKQQWLAFPSLPLVARADATPLADDDAGVVFLCQRDLDV